MKLPTVKHTLFEGDRWGKRVLMQLRKKGVRKKFYQSEFVFQVIRHHHQMRTVSLGEVIPQPKVVLENFSTRNGNVSPYELMVLASIASSRQARRVLEIGTFDGNTTLQLALNTPEDAVVHTIDLPGEGAETAKPVLDSDVQFIHDTQKQQRKYKGSRVESKVIQHFGDSTCYDFQNFCSHGNPELIFIDGGHSFECVQSDTFRALDILSDTGCLLWHDYTPLFGGVFHFLTQLAKELPLVHIEGTHLVYYTKENT